MYAFTLHLKACDHTKFSFNFPWYSLRMSFKGPQSFMFMALDHSVKIPLGTVACRLQYLMKLGRLYMACRNWFDIWSVIQFSSTTT